MSLKRQLAEEEGFLGRWSRLKREQSLQTEEISVPEPEESEQKTAPLSEEATELEAQEQSPTPLPDVETLGAGSDYKPFMHGNVAPDLRSQALRKLWASNPLYNHIDMLDDYCEDYTDKAMVVPGMKTAYKVGRGFLDKAKEIAERVDSEAQEPMDDTETRDDIASADNQQSIEPANTEKLA